MDNPLDSELGITGYNCYRRDRSSQTSVLEKQGGMLIDVRKNIHPSKLHFDSFVDLSELLFVSLQINSETVIIAATYISQEMQKTVNTRPYLRHSYVVHKIFNTFLDCKLLFLETTI